MQGLRRLLNDNGRNVPRMRKSAVLSYDTHLAQTSNAPVPQPSPSAKGGARSAYVGFSRKRVVHRRERVVKDDEFMSSTELPEMESEEGAPFADQHARLRSIMKHQHFDGLFPLNSQIAALVSSTVEELQGQLKEMLQKLNTVQLSAQKWETVWATCLAVQLMRTQLPELHEEWELVVEKAEKRVAALVQSPQSVAAIQQAATDLLQVSFKAD